MIILQNFIEEIATAEYDWGHSEDFSKVWAQNLIMVYIYIRGIYAVVIIVAFFASFLFMLLCTSMPPNVWGAAYNNIILSQ